MKTLFSMIQIGQTFHTGKGWGMGAMKGVQYWVEYKKTDKSHALITAQVGYGNTRMVGRTEAFAAAQFVFPIE